MRSVHDPKSEAFGSYESHADDSIAILRLLGIAVNTAKYKTHLTVTFESSRSAAMTVTAPEWVLWLVLCRPTHCVLKCLSISMPYILTLSAGVFFDLTYVFCVALNVAVRDPRWKDLIELVACHLHGYTDPANQRAAACLQRLAASADLADSAYVRSSSSSSLSSSSSSSSLLRKSQ